MANSNDKNEIIIIGGASHNNFHIDLYILNFYFNINGCY
ncbi:hypothetical protein KRV43_11810 [Staphylococcus xylosus]|nr:hypothetical protein [Staphylococcus xylosus]MBO3075591.1 hypothetical protein [Staphylococcus xylosus]MBV5140377.1 hypothetical protein [Staphylococcus xylosus]MBW3126643.1 hypothetical protein [Staphylococcus xylosus]MCD8783033.1 hypothetical protein [Staphylococcus xylosus]